MTKLQKKLYDICKSLELYSGYTEGIMELVIDEEDAKTYVEYYEKHPNIREGDFLMAVDIMHSKRYEPERLYDDEINVEMLD